MRERTNTEWNAIDQRYYLPTFRRFPLALVRGQGSRVWDADGRSYIDLLAGIAVNNVGHCHPAVVSAIQEQAMKLTHVSNFFVNGPQAELSERLVHLSGLERVFFTNSGAESLEGAFKLARKYAHSRGRGGEILSFEGSFHGRTLATIASGKRKYQEGFEPIPAGFRQVAFNDIAAVEAAVSRDTAAVVIEPIQGEGGINVADGSFLRALRALCDREDLVLIFDEVQTGVGRTGHWFTKDHYGIQPDIMTLAKGLGGGVPIGAILSNARVSAAIDFGDHGTTFGGNPLVCAASLAVLRVIEDENLLEAAREKGEWLRAQFAGMPDRGIREVRGMGLMVGVEFEVEAKPLVLDLLDRGVIANVTAERVLRLVPPLNISREDLREAMSHIDRSLEKLSQDAK